MQSFVGQVVLFLLFAQAWLQRCPLELHCADNHLLVIVGRDLLRNGRRLESYQVILGNGCKITWEGTDCFHMKYSFWDCGIEMKASENMDTFITSVKFFSIDYFYGGTVQITIVCIVPRKTKEHSPVMNQVVPTIKFREKQSRRSLAYKSSTEKTSSNGSDYEKMCPIPETEALTQNSFLVPYFLTKFYSLLRRYGSSSVSPRCF